MAFPTRAPSLQYYSEAPTKRQIQVKFESGKPMARAAATLSKMTITTGWTSLSQTEWTALKAHFVAYQGTAWSFTAPDATVYSVFYVGDSLPMAKPVGEVDGQTAWDVGPIQLIEA